MPNSRTTFVVAVRCGRNTRYQTMSSADAIAAPRATAMSGSVSIPDSVHVGARTVGHDDVTLGIDRLSVARVAVGERHRRRVREVARRHAVAAATVRAALRGPHR